MQARSAYLGGDFGSIERRALVGLACLLHNAPVHDHLATHSSFQCLFGGLLFAHWGKSDFDSSSCAGWARSEIS